MTSSYRESLYRSFVRQVSLTKDSPEATAAPYFDVVNRRENICGKLVRPIHSILQIFATFFRGRVKPLFSQLNVCLSAHRTFITTLSSDFTDYGYHQQMYEVFHDAILAAAENTSTTDVGNFLDLTSPRLDTILDNVIDTFTTYMLNVVAGESVLKIMRELVAGDNLAHRTLSFRHSVLHHIDQKLTAKVVAEKEEEV